MATSSTPNISSNMASLLASSSAKPAGASAMGKDDFLKLLTSQMKYQNPLDPISNSDFAAQLAQFSSLDAVQQLNQNFNNFMLMQGLTQGAQLIGKKISFTTAGSSVVQQGVVDSVQNVQGKVTLKVGNTTVDIANVQGVLKS